MEFQAYTPRPPLADFVELFWHFDGYALTGTRERVLPTGDVQLIISLGNAPLRTFDTPDAARSQSHCSPLVCGPHSTCSIIDTTPLGSSMGVQFKPGGAFPFLGAPPGELHNLNVSLEALWGKRAAELRDRLLDARSPSARFEILEQSLLSRLHAGREHHPAILYALREFHGVPSDQTIGEVVKDTGLSSKWFIEVFRAQVGLTPKLYCRLRRFQKALTLIGPQESLDWAGLALALGYYDQAHFIRDFRSFSGLTPTAYLADRCEHQNHVRISD